MACIYNASCALSINKNYKMFIESNLFTVHIRLNLALISNYFSTFRYLHKNKSIYIFILIYLIYLYPFIFRTLYTIYTIHTQYIHPNCHHYIYIFGYHPLYIHIATTLYPHYYMYKSYN